VAFALAFWLPLLGGLAIGLVADRSAAGALLLLAEPLLAVLAVYVGLALALHCHWRLAGASAAGLLAGFAAMHLPPTLHPPPPLRPTWSQGLRDCAQGGDTHLQGPLRLVQWTVDPSRPLADEALADLARGADLFVLQGASSPAPGTTIADAMDGQVRFYPAGEAGLGGLTVAVRGNFLRCGSEEDAWGAPLPAREGGGARMVVNLIEVEGVGRIPLVSVQLDSPHGPADWADWPDRLDQGARQVAAAVQAIDPDRVLLVGDLGVPPSFRHLAGQLEGAGLRELALPPSWPARLWGLPALPLHRLDRLWVGRDWALGSTRPLQARGQARVPVRSVVVPEVMTAH